MKNKTEGTVTILGEVWERPICEHPGVLAYMEWSRGKIVLGPDTILPSITEINTEIMVFLAGFEAGRKAS